MKSTLLAALIFIMAATPTFGMSRPQAREAVSIEVVSDSGSVFQSIPHEDFWKSNTPVFKNYLEARKGEQYGIVIRNRTAGRVGVVIAVDGRNIISGKLSNLRSNENMYIVNAGETTRLDGWRTSQDQVHRFFFTDAADSYSVKTFADSSAMGVIGVAVYREKQPPRPVIKEKQELSGAPAPAAKKSQSADRSLASENAGTGFGDAQYSPVYTVQFDPERTAMQKTLIKYEWRETLCRKSILRCNQELGNRLWDENQYAPYPPNYPRN